MSTPIRSRSSTMQTPSRSGFRPPSRQSTKLTTTSSPSRSRPNSSFGMSRPTTPYKEPYTGTITVSIRPNPINNDSSSWVMNQDTIRNTYDNSQFQFDHVFDKFTNSQAYHKCCKPIVGQFLTEGYNGTVFAYGMTGSGKTYSMKGDGMDDPGFIDLTIDDIFNTLDVNNHNFNYILNLSYLEIYNEKIIDLLNISNSGGDLKIRDDVNGDIKVIGLTSNIVQSKQQCLQLIKRGETNRKTSATDFNARSSRSHSILQIRLTKLNLQTQTELKSTLSLCDLAGSERASSSLERRKEGAYINKSLLALSNVINKLSTNDHHHIPYRDSKLTRLLQPALSGSSLISILCTIHIGSPFVSETLKTLRFAARAKEIIINVEKNTSSQMNDNVIQDLNNIIDQQKKEIDQLKQSQNVPTASDDSELKILYEKLDHLTRLTDLQKTETILIKNDVLNDILGSGIDKSQLLMHNIEDFYQRTQYEQEEYKSYIEILENKLKNSNDDQLSLNILKEQEEEIIQLKEQLRDKDQIIKSLTKTTKLRKLVESNNQSSYKLDNKENSDSTLKDFKISPKKPKSNFNLMETF